MRTAISAVLLCVLVGESSAEDRLTPNAFLSPGLPTIVIGTAGGDHADREIAGQARMIRALIWPAAKIVADTSIDAAGGADGWPIRPILYGGPHVNALLARLELPFEMSRGRLRIGGRTYAGDSIRLLTVVPGRAGPGGHPSFLLYAGTGDPGVAEINGVTHGGAPILIADEFGPRVAGRWVPAGTNGWKAELGREARRIPWRLVERKIGAKGATARIAFPNAIEPNELQTRQVAAAVRGLERAAAKFGDRDLPAVTLFVYPDRGSKRALVGTTGDGEAVVSARAMHVVGFDPKVTKGFESLIAHEGTHVFTQVALGPAGSPLLGEGIAVWAAGDYGGQALASYRGKLGDAPSIATLLGMEFRRLPEGRAYPLAGLFVETLIETVGFDTMAEHLYATTAEDWEARCKAAGTTSIAIESKFRANLKAPK